MLETKGKLRILKFDDKKYKRDLDSAVKRELKNAIREWLHAVLGAVSGAPFTVGDSFPLSTGMAKASLTPVGRLVQETIALAVAPGQKSRISQGKAAAFATLTQDRPGWYTFNYQNTVEHYEINETESTGRGGSFTPWNTFVAGDAAFESYVNDVLFDKLPDLSEYIG